MIDPSIQAIEDASCLRTEQKRDILYSNAARLMRLGEVQIQAHHQWGRQRR
ncbi:MAG: hypothetical protein ABIP44_06860 [Pseudoxanthomonas sp.]